MYCRYGKGFGLVSKSSIFNIPNPIYGLMFYILIAVLSMYSIINEQSALIFFHILMMKHFFTGTINNYSSSAAVVVLGILSNISSIYLAYILYISNIICVVCIGAYIVNATITFLAVKKFRKLSTGVACKKKMKWVYKNYINLNATSCSDEDDIAKNFFYFNIVWCCIIFYMHFIFFIK